MQAKTIDYESSRILFQRTGLEVPGIVHNDVDPPINSVGCLCDAFQRLQGRRNIQLESGRPSRFEVLDRGESACCGDYLVTSLERGESEVASKARAMRYDPLIRRQDREMTHLVPVMNQTRRRDMWDVIRCSNLLLRTIGSWVKPLILYSL